MHESQSGPKRRFAAMQQYVGYRGHSGLEQAVRRAHLCVSGLERTRTCTHDLTHKLFPNYTAANAGSPQTAATSALGSQLLNLKKQVLDFATDAIEALAGLIGVVPPQDHSIVGPLLSIQKAER